MKLTVIGHLCLDVIHRPGEQESVRSYGGIFFAVAALANLLPENTSIAPVIGVGRNEYQAFFERLSNYPNVDTSAIYRFSEPTNEVHLYYHDERHRTECSRFIAEPIPFKRIKPHLDADMILINMVSGFDVTLETLDEIRMALRDRHTPVYFDVHSLSLGIAEDFTRVRRPLPDWRRWLFWLHAVQMNEEERAGLTDEEFADDMFAKHVTALNTASLIITRGANGCTVYSDVHKQVSRHEIPGIPKTRRVDATGCGDVFGAAYCAMYLSSRNALRSAEFANPVAASNATALGSTEIDQLAEFRLEPTRLEVPS